MDTQFGEAGQGFFVMIQTEIVGFSWLAWSTEENVLGTLAGINRINPNWSYLFIKFYALPNP